jgi:phosphatidylinositol glycan class B
MLQVGGVQPWYYYLIEGSKKALGPLCLFFVLFPLVFILKNPKHVLTAIFLPLFLLHSYIFHKEFRFIFPLLPLVSLMAALVFLNPTPFFKNIIKHKVFRVLVIISLVINFAAYLFVCFRPANSSHKFYAFMFNHPEVKSFYAVSETPYKMLGLKLAFYTPKVMTVTEIKSFSEIKDKDFFVFFNHANEAMNYVDNPHCKMFYSSYPNWFYKYNYTNWISRTRAWTMLHCNFAE